MENNLSPVLVFALAGKVGSGVSFVRDKLNQELSTYGYQSELFDVSRVVLQEQYQQYSSDDNTKSLDGLNKAERVKELQRRGNYLREHGEPDVIARMIFLDFIAKDLEKDERLEVKKAYIIDSLKHPEEALFLRDVFGDAFYLIGVVADDYVRKNRLIERKNFTKEEYEQVSNVDENEVEDYGQHAVDTVVLADYFLKNNHHTKDAITSETERLLRLIFNTSLDTPTKDEKGMNLAFQASFNSACLSRQVGASIFSEEGQILATGANDVPQFGGGLYAADSPLGDKRCWTNGAKCYNDNEKSRIIEEIVESVEKELDASDGLRHVKKDALEVVVGVVNRSRIKRLLEFSRSIHAEMDAIVSVARSGVRGLVGGTLYCTTYPCHNCAKHIVGSGIKRVVYLEPYEKSLARKLHADSICNPSQEDDSKLKLDHFAGVSPRRYNQFFCSANIERKTNGVFNDNDRKRGLLNPVGAQSKLEFKARLEVVSEEARAIIDAGETENV